MKKEDERLYKAIFDYNKRASLTFKDKYEIAYDILKVGFLEDRIERFEEIRTPKVILESVKRKLKEHLEKNPKLEDAYVEYKELEDSGRFYIKEIKLEKLENQEFPECIYQVSYKMDEKSEYQLDNNALYGTLFDTKELALLQLYKYCYKNHPIYDEIMEEALDKKLNESLEDEEL